MILHTNLLFLASYLLGSHIIHLIQPCHNRWTERVRNLIRASPQFLYRDLLRIIRTRRVSQSQDMFQQDYSFYA